MAELLAHDLQTRTSPAAPAAIQRLQTGLTAFVGRALRGPVDQPVAIHSFADFQQHFGGLWQPSTMSYAVEQYFEAGGRSALIVRVVNGGLSTTLQLPAGPQRLTLRGLAPGTREYLRASVDYDGITEGDRFNLVVQRVRAPGTEQIEDQEIFRRVNVRADGDRFIGDVLTQSRLVRMLGPAPTQRPDRTGGRGAGALVGYVDSNPDGNDGEELWDYDVIGSAERGSGLFALQGAGHFDLLCVPPLSRERDVGLATLVVATRLCRDHHALLIVDPPTRWDSGAAACEGVRSWPLQTHDACMFYPRLRAYDRLRGHHEVFAACGAVAGLLARGDESYPVWGAAAGDELALRGSLRPALTLDAWQCRQLAHHGVNALQVQGGTDPAFGPRTLVPELAQRSDWRHLSVRRLGLFITACIEEGTRWALLENNAPPLWGQVVTQVQDFLAALDADGAFVGNTAAESYFVICDERLNGGKAMLPGCFRLLFGFAAVRSGQFQSCLLTHRPGGSETQAVSVNRLHTSERRVDEEIETAILRGLGQDE